MMSTLTSRAFPLAEDGLEYLLGAVCVAAGAPTFLDWWSHNPNQERRSFQAFITWLYARWKANPTMRVYHYSSYETAAMRRLMGKHATHEKEVDELLRNQVFVDLYTVVRQGVTIGTPGYSLKDIECLYLESRKGQVTTAGGSVVAYHAWMESGESEKWQESPLFRRFEITTEWIANRHGSWRNGFGNSSGWAELITFPPSSQVRRQWKVMAAPPRFLLRPCDSR